VYAANKYAWHFAGRRHHELPLFLFHPIEHKLVSIPGVLFGGFEPYVRNLMMAMAAIPWLLFAVARARRGPAPQGLRARAHALRFELLALVLFAVYLVAPVNIKGTTLVYHRFLPPAWAVVAVSAAAHTRSIARAVPRALCAALPVASLLISWPTFVDSNRVYTTLEALLPRMQPGTAVMSLNFGPPEPHRLWSPTVVMGHVVAVHGGRALYDYTQSPVSPVAQRPEKEWIEPVERLEGRPDAVRPEWDLTRFRYLLVWTGRPGLGAAIELAIQDCARLLAHEGDWYLFESTLPQVPIDADDAPLPVPRPSTLRRRLDDVAALLRDVDRDLRAERDAPAR